MGKLDGKVAVITGGSSGIGRATAIALAAEGASVAIGGRKAAALEEVAGIITKQGGKVLTQTMDVRDETQVAALVDAAVSDFGRLDIMVNNAGVSYPGNISDGKVEEWREMLETNVLALLIGCREAIRVMKQNDPPGGSIVNISSVAARSTGDSGQVYSATKHAVNAISDGLRQEVHDANIRVTVVMPGGTLTNFGRTMPQEVLTNAAKALGLDADEEGVKHGEYLPAAGVERVLRDHPGVFLSADDIANAVLYAVQQPQSVQVDEVLVRPSVGMSLGG
ncbi:MAG: SDR family oxidoreductase [Chloroflexi bacterium]|nr:SDR family oxidoreductase [Chloroflexota bacterium]